VVEAVDGQVVAKMFGVSEAVVRQWTHRGKLRRVGTDHKRRALYDWAEVQALRDKDVNGA
jgi:predicted site-specific integrase-resolvase